MHLSSEQMGFSVSQWQLVQIDSFKTFILLFVIFLVKYRVPLATFGGYIIQIKVFLPAIKHQAGEEIFMLTGCKSNNKQRHVVDHRCNKFFRPVACRGQQISKSFQGTSHPKPLACLHVPWPSTGSTSPG